MKYYLYYVNEYCDRIIVARSRKIKHLFTKSNNLNHDFNGKLLCIGDFQDNQEKMRQGVKIFYNNKLINGGF